jgi:hypothetical protein
MNALHAEALVMNEGSIRSGASSKQTTKWLC